MLLRWITARLSLVMALICALALVGIPTLLAIAHDHHGAVVSGKRVKRREGRVVTVATSHKGLLDEDDDDDEAEAQSPGEQPVSSPTAPAPPIPTPRVSVPTPGAPTPTPGAPTPTPTLPGAPSGPCNGIDVAPGGNLASAASSAPEGATLCLAPGEYTVSSPVRPKNGQQFIGAGAGATSVTTTSAPAVFDAKGVSDVVWQHLSISGATGSESCKPACGRGISGGANSVIDHVRIHDNANAGIGGTDGSVVITNSELDSNGSEAFTGCCAAGIKSANGYTITNSYIHDNVGVGVWCDVGCSGIPFEVSGNRILNNLLGGIRFEISSGPTVIRGNVVQGNNRANQGGHGGIEINSSQNATVEGNTLGGNGGAGIIANGSRSPGLSNVVISNNQLGGDKLNGCGGGVACTTNS